MRVEESSQPRHQLFHGFSFRIPRFVKAGVDHQRTRTTVHEEDLQIAYGSSGVVIGQSHPTPGLYFRFSHSSLPFSRPARPAESGADRADSASTSLTVGMRGS